MYGLLKRNIPKGKPVPTKLSKQ